jgi:ComF family protein
MGEWWTKVLNELLDVVMPARCPACDELVDDGREVFCNECAEHVLEAPRTGLARGRGPLDALVSAFEYGGPLARAIVRFKHGDTPALGRRLTRLALDVARPPAAELVVPVPLYRSRMRRRGFNQANVIAREVAHRCGGRLVCSSLVRLRDTPSQGILDPARRRRNVDGAFSVARSRHPFAGRGVLLVDDVWTTGATARACARTLLAAGCRRVEAFTLARVM